MSPTLYYCMFSDERLDPNVLPPCIPATPEPPNEAPWLVYVGGLPNAPITKAGPLAVTQIIVRAVDPIPTQ